MYVSIGNLLRPRFNLWNYLHSYNYISQKLPFSTFFSKWHLLRIPTVDKREINVDDVLFIVHLQNMRSKSLIVTTPCDRIQTCLSLLLNAESSATDDSDSSLASKIRLSVVLSVAAVFLLCEKHHFMGNTGGKQGKKYAAAALGLFKNREFIAEFEKLIKKKSPNLKIVSQPNL